jgi:1,4-dihydroxy-2-naphthoate octaprenyltransferase
MDRLRNIALSAVHPDQPALPFAKVRIWWMAIRPKTLTLAATPVLVGTALGWRDSGALNALVFGVALICALMIQAGTNLFNDAADAQSGNDGPDRLGPERVTANGLASAREVRQAAFLAFALAFAGGIYLVTVGGWPILAIGIASLAAGWAYSGGPRPLSHTAWGEVAVVVFFGVAAVAGSYYLQRGDLSWSAVGVGVALGLHAAAVLLLNNLRDHESDRRAGRRTLVQLIGTRLSYWMYALLLVAPFPLLTIGLSVEMVGLGWIVLPVCLWLAWRCSQLPPSPLMNTQLALTAFAQVLLGSLLSVSLLQGVV